MKTLEKDHFIIAMLCLIGVSYFVKIFIRVPKDCVYLKWRWDNPSPSDYDKYTTPFQSEPEYKD
jgi:hypothetical protein